MNKKITLIIIALFMTIFLSTAAQTQPIKLASANPGIPTSSPLAMLIEHVNYTITQVNGTLWAKIDGIYPIRKLFAAGTTYELDSTTYCVSSNDLPMLYPTPPGTTNIHVRVNGTELNWTNYAENDASATHHTAIGDWRMILCVLTNTSDDFLLTIHYEHPLEVVNSSYLFLYDLNINPYLTPWSSNSTAYFTVRMETAASDVRVYTTETDTVWNPKNFTISREGTTDVVSIQMYSELSQPLAGDLVVMFSGSSTEAFPYWIIIVLLFVVGSFLAVIAYQEMRRR